jgi:hypothetical protein
MEHTKKLLPVLDLCFSHRDFPDPERQGMSSEENLHKIKLKVINV